MSRPDKADSVQFDLRKGRSLLTVIVEGIEGIALVVASVLFWPILRPFLLHFGSTLEERANKWPGEDALQGTTCKVTRALATNAPVCLPGFPLEP
jgi:hypothetical protein